MISTQLSAKHLDNGIKVELTFSFDFKTQHAADEAEKKYINKVRERSVEQSMQEKIQNDIVLIQELLELALKQQAEHIKVGSLSELDFDPHAKEI